MSTETSGPTDEQVAAEFLLRCQPGPSCVFVSAEYLSILASQWATRTMDEPPVITVAALISAAKAINMSAVREHRTWGTQIAVDHKKARRLAGYMPKHLAEVAEEIAVVRRFRARDGGRAFCSCTTEGH